MTAERNSTDRIQECLRCLDEIAALPAASLLRKKLDRVRHRLNDLGTISEIMMENISAPAVEFAFMAQSKKVSCDSYSEDEITEIKGKLETLRNLLSPLVAPMDRFACADIVEATTPSIECMQKEGDGPLGLSLKMIGAEACPYGERLAAMRNSMLDRLHIKPLARPEQTTDISSACESSLFDLESLLDSIKDETSHGRLERIIQSYDSILGMVTGDTPFPEPQLMKALREEDRRMKDDFLGLYNEYIDWPEFIQSLWTTKILVESVVIDHCVQSRPPCEDRIALATALIDEISEMPAAAPLEKMLQKTRRRLLDRGTVSPILSEAFSDAAIRPHLDGIYSDLRAANDNTCYYIGDDEPAVSKEDIAKLHEKLAELHDALVPLTQNIDYSNHETITHFLDNFLEIAGLSGNVFQTAFMYAAIPDALPKFITENRNAENPESTPQRIEESLKKLRAFRNTLSNEELGVKMDRLLEAYETLLQIAESPEALTVIGQKKQSNEPSFITPLRCAAEKITPYFVELYKEYGDEVRFTLPLIHLNNQMLCLMGEYIVDYHAKPSGTISTDEIQSQPNRVNEITL